MKKHILILLLTICTSCQSCSDDFYFVHTKLTPLEITCYKKIDSIEIFKTFIDSLNDGNKKCSCMTAILDKNEKIIYFSGGLREGYKITIKEDRIIVTAVCIPSVDSTYWLANEEQVDDSISNRIGVWISKNVLDKYQH